MTRALRRRRVGNRVGSAVSTALLLVGPLSPSRTLAQAMSIQGEFERREERLMQDLRRHLERRDDRRAWEQTEDRRAEDRAGDDRREDARRRERDADERRRWIEADEARRRELRR